jgi:peroxiredoxin (alkyl hydroperoxide reductase subunit C)
MEVDWMTLPRPSDDGSACHLIGFALPDVALTATDDSTISLARLTGRTVVFIYPMTGRPGVALPDGWDQIPGARGCTPQTCAFRDLYADLRAAGADRVYGFSTQDSAYQQEAAERLHLPFPLLSDANLEFSRAARLPMMTVDGLTLAKHLALIVDNGIVVHAFYPVFPPDRNAADVLAWLKSNKCA